MKFSEMINEILEDIVKEYEEENLNNDDKNKIEKECNKFFLRSKL